MPTYCMRNISAISSYGENIGLRPRLLFAGIFDFMEAAISLGGSFSYMRPHLAPFEALVIFLHEIKFSEWQSLGYFDILCNFSVR